MNSYKSVVAIGNILFILWILYNGIDEGFKDILNLHGIIPIGLAVLLAFNTVLILRSK